MLSAGTAISFGVDAAKQPYQNTNAALFACTTLCWPLLAIAMWFGAKDTNYFSEDTVVAPLHVLQGVDVQKEEDDAVEATTIDNIGEKA